MARGIWNGAISFGLLNIPVAVMSSKEEERLSFRMIDKKNMSPIGYKQINKLSGREVDRKNIVKAFETDDKELVILDEKDFIRASPKATQTIDIEDFVDLEDLDLLLLEKPYYLVPGKNGEKGYMLLRKVLENTKKVAIAKFVLRTRQHLTAIIPRGEYLILETLRFSHEVQEIHEAQYLDDVDFKKVKISAREMQAAESLVKSMTAKWKPDQYKDTYQDELVKYIKRKVKAGNVEELPDVAPEEYEPNVDSVDLMGLLERSLEAGGKKAPAKPVKKPKTAVKKKVASRAAPRKKVHHAASAHA